jgi:hypothetical protein
MADSNTELKYSLNILRTGILIFLQISTKFVAFRAGRRSGSGSILESRRFLCLIRDPALSDRAGPAPT